MSGPFDFDAPSDPVKRAQALARPELPRRFYADVAVAEADGGFVVALDGKATRTPGGAPAVVPARDLAEALAAEWAAQATHIDAASMPLVRLLNAALDGVAARAEAVADSIAAYAGSDLLCYRPDGPERLVARTTALWDPVLAWAEETLGARFVLAEGVMPVAQPAETIAAVRRTIPTEPPLVLAAVQALTTLTGSAVLALAVAYGRLTVDAAWEAAHVDEDWNIGLWGADAEALARRAAREVEARAAARVVAALPPALPRRSSPR